MAFCDAGTSSPYRISSLSHSYSVMELAQLLGEPSYDLLVGRACTASGKYFAHLTATINDLFNQSQ